MTDIQTTLNYNTDDGTRPFFYFYDRTEEQKANDVKKNGEGHAEMMGGAPVVNQKTTVYDGRGKNLDLDKNSFTLVDQKTDLTTEDFYNGDRITSDYYKEIEQMFMKETGAAHVKVFHHQVRCEAKKDGGKTQGYAQGVHSDSSHAHAPDVFKGYA